MQRHPAAMCPQGGCVTLHGPVVSTVDCHCLTPHAARLVVVAVQDVCTGNPTFYDGNIPFAKFNCTPTRVGDSCYGECEAGFTGTPTATCMAPSNVAGWGTDIGTWCWKGRYAGTPTVRTVTSRIWQKACQCACATLLCAHDDGVRV